MTGGDSDRSAPSSSVGAVTHLGFGFLVSHDGTDFTIYGGDGQRLAATPYDWLASAIVAHCARRLKRRSTP